MRRDVDDPAPRRPQLTIAAVARRTGLGVHTLRAWERRYGIPAPHRSEGRYRLYGVDDLDLLRRMQSFIAAGVGTAEAARRARAGERQVPAGEAEPAVLAAALLDAFVAMDREAVHRAINLGLVAHGVVGLLDVVVQTLHELGELWAQGRVGVDVEHFASQALRSRLGGLAADTPQGNAGHALLVCPPGERHDLPLLVLSLRLLEAGWHPTLLGADVPVESTVATVLQQLPALVCVSCTDPANAERAMVTAAAARRVAPPTTRVLVGGQGIGADRRRPAGVEGEAALASVLAGAGPEPPATSV